MSLDDSKIIELFFERSQQGITELSQKYGKLSLRIAENILNNREDAEECVNDAYAAFWNKVPPEKPDPLCTYLMKIVRNLALKKYHSNKAIKRNSYYDTALEELENVLSLENSAENEYSAREISTAVNTFLSGCEKKTRIMFVRRYFFGDTVKEIATLSGNTPHFVSVKLSRTRTALKKYLIEEGFI